MKLGILAPTDYAKICHIIKLDPSFFEKAVAKAATIVAAKHDIVVVPHQGSGSHEFAEIYKDGKGKKVIGIVPKRDTEFGIEHLNTEVCDEIIDAGTWRNVPECLCETSDSFLVLGWGPGIAVEVGQTKWFKVKKIFVVKELISGNKLAPELDQQLPIKYISLDEIDKI